MGRLPHQPIAMFSSTCKMAPSIFGSRRHVALPAPFGMTVVTARCIVWGKHATTIKYSLTLLFFACTRTPVFHHEYFFCDSFRGILVINLMSRHIHAVCARRNYSKGVVPARLYSTSYGLDAYLLSNRLLLLLLVSLRSGDASALIHRR